MANVPTAKTLSVTLAWSESQSSSDGSSPDKLHLPMLIQQNKFFWISNRSGLMEIIWTVAHRRPWMLLSVCEDGK